MLVALVAVGDAGVVGGRKRKNEKGPPAWTLEGLTFGYGAGGRNRTGTGFDPRGILSPVRLPISPLRHVRYYAQAAPVSQACFGTVTMN